MKSGRPVFHVLRSHGSYKPTPIIVAILDMDTSLSEPGPVSAGDQKFRTFAFP